jgi:hypothetical protein
MTADFCAQQFAHDRYQPARGEDGQTYCVIDYPIRRPGFDPTWYWDFGPELVTGFDDAAQQAHEYDLADEPVQTRPYTEEETVRADALGGAVSVAQAQADLDRAIALNAAPEELRILQEATLAAEGIEEGDPWRQPTGAHDAYPLGAVVTHNGQTWESLIAANVWEPPTNWRQVGGGIPDWVQPTGSTDAYPLGAIVRHNDLVWESDLDANVWEPGVFGWTEIPDPEMP